MDTLISKEAEIKDELKSLEKDDKDIYEYILWKFIDYLLIYEYYQLNVIINEKVNIIDFKKSEEQKGNPTATIEISNYERTAYPFAAYVLTIIGIAVASKKSREGVGKNLVIGLFCGLIYIFFMKMTTVATVNIGMNTLLAVWFPNLFFSVVAIYIYFKRLNA